MCAARIRIALQKSGRLSHDSVDLLKRCGIHIRIRDTKLYYHSENFPLDTLMVRDDDIPALVSQGTCDLGIVGSNVLEEAKLTAAHNSTEFNVQIEQALTFGHCRLAIAAPQKMNFSKISDLNGKRIATSYPAILRKYLSDNHVKASVTTLTGSVELAPALNLADAICDLVSTGATLESNGLIELETIFSSHALLIRTLHPLKQDKIDIIDKLAQRLGGVLTANETKYIMLHAPTQSLEKIVEMLPGAEHPTILPLQNCPDKVAIHAVCTETIFWETLEKLKSGGASSILVLPVEKMLV